MFIFLLKTSASNIVSYSEVVITLDFESSIPGSNPGKRIFLFILFMPTHIRKRAEGWHKNMVISFQKSCYWVICLSDYTVLYTVLQRMDMINCQQIHGVPGQVHFGRCAK